MFTDLATSLNPHDLIRPYPQTSSITLRASVWRQFPIPRPRANGLLELMMLIGTRGKPQMIVSDNEIEFTSKAMLGWAKDHGVNSHNITLGGPMQNGYIESL